MQLNKITIIFLMMMLVITACSTNFEDAGNVFIKATADLSTEISAENAAEIDPSDAISAQATDVVLEDFNWPGYDDDDLDDSLETDDLIRVSLVDNNITVKGEGGTVSGNTLTITSAGVYQLEGSLSEGQIVVDTQDEEVVRLILNGIEITSSISVPVYIINAKKTVITLAEGTMNFITDLSADAAVNGEANAAVFSNDDLTINGMGKLTVKSENHHGIASDDDLKVVSGAIMITALKDGLQGKDLIAVKDGQLTIEAGSDGMHANNDVDVGEGNIYIEGGSVKILSEQDGIQAEHILAIAGGEIEITSGGGSTRMSSTTMSQWGDWDRQKTSTDGEASAKGLKADNQLLITGGAFVIDSADDALHSNNSIQIDGGDFSLASGDDGLHADTTLEINGGELNIIQSYEGLESATITINNGRVEILAVDDGINGSSGTSGVGMGGGRGGQFGSGDCSLVINGGSITVTAEGDGIDINGTIEVNAGVLLINGPTGNMNGALDYMGSFAMNGGLLLAIGSAGMPQAPSAASTQPSFIYNFETVQQAGTAIQVQSENGEEIIIFIPKKAYQSVVISSPEFVEGETYQIFSGGRADGDIVDGLCTNCVYTPGSQVDAFTFSEIVMSLGVDGTMWRQDDMPMGGPGGGRPGKARP
jgi:hypothetical protein